MRLVLAALTRPFTVIVVVLALALCSILAIERMRMTFSPRSGKEPFTWHSRIAEWIPPKWKDF